MTDHELLARIHALHATALRRRGGTAGFPDELKRLVAAYVRLRREEGSSWSVAAEPLPVSSTTARKWAVREEPPARTLVPVAVIDDVEPVRTEPVVGLRLTSPAGYQLTGLSLEQAVQLLGHLR